MGRVLLLVSLCAVLAISPLSLTQLVGAPETIQDLSSEEVTNAAQAAVNELNGRSKSMFKTVLVEVTEGTVQVVAGDKYVLTLLVGKSFMCRNDGVPATTAECPVSKITLETWSATILHHSWYSPEYEILELEKPGAQKEVWPPMGGGTKPIKDIQDPGVLAAAQEAVKELNKRSNSLYKLVFIEVVDGTVKVVAGFLYTLKVLVGRSAVCRNDGKVATLKECPVLPDTLEAWRAVIWDHPVSPPKYDILELEKLLL